jgi:mannitol-1-/sugar-/sorbitol-6-/2-deoxyglucose-6-phosphatase
MSMKFSAAIFDMDGVLIDSEPLWKQAAAEVFDQYNLKIPAEKFAQTTGLRTSEFVKFWFEHYKIDMRYAGKAEADIVLRVIDKILAGAKPFPGIEHIFTFFMKRNIRIGLASSSPSSVIDVVIDYLGIRDHIDSISSAENLAFGKPHPQVYLNCAEALGVKPTSCLCFEDSFNGLLSAKAARMACVIIPPHEQRNDPRWAIADLKIGSLTNFNELLMNTIKTV